MKELIKELAKAINYYSLDPLVYIASPFFDDFSKEWVSAREEELEGFRIPYFSPRQDGINFNAVSGKIRSERIKAIFQNNVRNLELCECIKINLNPCNDRLDIGTLWEMGYFIGSHGAIEFSDENTLSCQPELENRLRKINKNLGDTGVDPNEEGTIDDPEEQVILISKDQDYNRVRESLRAINADYTIYRVNMNLNDLDLNSTDLTILIDDYPMELFILMGWLYAKGIPYKTASLKGFGSNVMIAASSKGHIKLPGLLDDTYNENMK